MAERERVGRDWKMGERESWEGVLDGREGELGESGRGIGRLQSGGWGSGRWERVVYGSEW